MNESIQSIEKPPFENSVYLKLNESDSLFFEVRIPTLPRDKWDLRITCFHRTSDIQDRKSHLQKDEGISAVV